MKKVAFICYANACRSQIAEGLSKLLGKGLYKSYSAGLCPLSMVAAGVYEVMDKRGIDISDQYSKGLEEIPIAEMDFVISLASFPAAIVCPGDFAGSKLNWNIPDPYGARAETFEEITDLIECKLKNFIKENFKK
jgi:arsenate reductase